MIPPIQSALSFKNIHLELLQSYVASPEVHWRAARTPAVMGGPWVDVDPARAAEVERFLEESERSQRHRIALARDVERLDRLLAQRAKGGGLAPLYSEVPDQLRGYVELVYDASHQPSARYFEPLLYRSELYERHLQSIALRQLTRDARVPEFTTPTLDGDPDLVIQRPFSDPAWDALFAMKQHPACADALAEQLGIPRASLSAFRDFFADDPPPSGEKTPPNTVRLRYFGHACVLFESPEVTFLVDPVLSYDYGAEPRRLTYADLPARIDYLALTHFHKDHVNLETLLQLRHRAEHVIVPKHGSGAVQDASFRLMLENVGFRNVIELERLDPLAIPGGAIMAIPFMGEHADLDVQSKAGYAVRLGGRTVVFAADAANLESRLYTHVRRWVGEIDALFLGMECVGAPLSTTYSGVILRPLSRELDQQRRTTGSDYQGAMGIIRELSPKEVYIYAMGLEPWLGHLLPIVESRDSLGVRESDRVIEDCRHAGIVAGRPYCFMERLLAQKG